MEGHTHRDLLYDHRYPTTAMEEQINRITWVWLFRTATNHLTKWIWTISASAHNSCNKCQVLAGNTTIDEEVSSNLAINQFRARFMANSEEMSFNSTYKWTIEHSGVCLQCKQFEIIELIKGLDQERQINWKTKNNERN